MISIVKDTVFAALKSLNKTNVQCSLGLWKKQRTKLLHQ